MDPEIEMTDLKARRKVDPTKDTAPGPRINVDADQDQAVALWAYVATTLLLILAVPMVFFPNVLLYVAETTEERRNALTPLESFLALHSGILLIAFAVSLIFNIPTSTALQVPNSDPPRHPLLAPLTTACALIAFLSYNTTSVGFLSTIVFLGSTTISLWGMWTMVFSGTSYLSRKTGADKRTSRFLFGNKAAASSQKKEWKKEQSKKSK